jgi:hypothetical protein
LYSKLCCLEAKDVIDSSDIIEISVGEEGGEVRKG